MTQLSNSMAARDVAHHLHPCTNITAHEQNGPLIFDRGEGIYLYDAQGRRYLEAMSGLWCATLGFSEQRLVDAATRQLARLPYAHTFRGRSSQPTIELAERLIEIAPAPMSKVFFANSGSEANETAIKIAWQYHHARGEPGRRKIIARERGYHGSTIGAGSLTGIRDFHRDFNMPLDFAVFAACPHYWKNGLPGESEEAFAERLADEIEALVLREGPDTIAAFIAEPVMGGSAVILPPSGYFERVQAVLRKYGILFIVDEVITGFGRSGNMFGSQTFGLTPDIMTLAKALSSAYVPLSATLISAPVYAALADESDRFGLFWHGFTYSGHPVATAVALEALKIYAERDIVGHVRKVESRFLAGLRSLVDRPFVGEVRGIGLMAAVELVADKATRRPFRPGVRAGEVVLRHAQDRGLHHPRHRRRAGVGAAADHHGARDRRDARRPGGRHQRERAADRRGCMTPFACTRQVSGPSSMYKAALAPPSTVSSCPVT